MAGKLVEECVLAMVLQWIAQCTMHTHNTYPYTVRVDTLYYIYLIECFQFSKNIIHILTQSHQMRLSATHERTQTTTSFISFIFVSDIEQSCARRNSNWIAFVVASNQMAGLFQRKSILERNRRIWWIESLTYRLQTNRKCSVVPILSHGRSAVQTAYAYDIPNVYSVQCTCAPLGRCAMCNIHPHGGCATFLFLVFDECWVRKRCIFRSALTCGIVVYFSPTSGHSLLNCFRIRFVPPIPYMCSYMANDHICWNSNSISFNQISRMFCSWGTSHVHFRVFISQ